MKIQILLSVALAATFFSGCSGVVTPTVERAYHNDSAHNIPAIDNMIVEMKQEYINKCYMPVANRKPPENSCQTDLFQMLERRYHMNFNQNHVAIVSNELFFKDIEKEIHKMARTDPEVRNAIRNVGFTSNEEMIAYYRDKYKFETQLEQY